MCNEKIICSVCGKEHPKQLVESYRISEDNGFCEHSKSIDICENCFDASIKMTSKGTFLIYKNNLYYYKPCYFDRINSKEEIDRIFNKDYYDILDIFTRQQCVREEN